MAVVLWGGCQSAKQKDSLETLFLDKEQHLTGVALEIASDDILAPMQMASLDRYLIVSNNPAQKGIRVYDWVSGEVLNDLVDQGRGPREMLNISSIDVAEEELFVYSSNAQRILRIPLSEIEKPIPEMTVVEFVRAGFRLYPAFNGHYLGIGQPGNERPFCLFDERGETVLAFGTYPEDGVTTDVQVKRLAYQGRGVVSPDGKNFVFASGYGTIFKFVRFSNDREIVREKDYVIALPEYFPDTDPSIERYSAVMLDNNIRGALNIIAGRDVCYILYEGRAMINSGDASADVYVFDWDGNPVKKLRLDREVSRIVYNSMENCLIALAKDENYNPIFVKYSL